MKRIASLLLLAAVSLGGALNAAEPVKAPASTPEETIRSFYHWYVTALIANRDPMNNRTELKGFATARL